MAHILVVDDDQSVASAFERFLRHEGHDCTIASNAEDAIRLVGEQEPDLVVMDIRMPGRDGLDALKELRASHPDVFVALMTAHGNSHSNTSTSRSTSISCARSSTRPSGRNTAAGGQPTPSPRRVSSASSARHRRCRTSTR
jgi:DNA-binding NtrC family response regulator